MLDKVVQRGGCLVSFDELLKEADRMLKARGAGVCPGCGKVIRTETEFRDNLSRKEYGISGLCQDCQDDVFGLEDE